MGVLLIFDWALGNCLNTGNFLATLTPFKFFLRELRPMLNTVAGQLF